jgi:hypothetical protein
MHVAAGLDGCTRRLGGRERVNDVGRPWMKQAKTERSREGQNYSHILANTVLSSDLGSCHKTTNPDPPMTLSTQECQLKGKSHAQSLNRLQPLWLPIWRRFPFFQTHKLAS